MPERTLNYDPTTPEGEHISGLFRSLKQRLGEEWSGAEAVQILNEWFERLGIDPDGDVFQVDPIPPLVIAPPADAENITRLLVAAGRFVDHGYATGHEGFFHTDEDHTCPTECVQVTFPTAPPALVRFAIAWLRQAGYTVRQVPATTPTQAAVHVEHGALYPRAAYVSTAEQAARVLWRGGFTTPDTRPADVVGTTTPTPVSWRPGWLQIGIVAPRTTGRDTRDEAANAATAVFTDHGWQVDYRSTDILHVTL